ncbi:MAG: class I SAM-dependent methyltransferase [Alphaproteobacteria bacterium]|nr:class I SAM-dependent methyltransferase [Alphaproteobacteria bacterium]
MKEKTSREYWSDKVDEWAYWADPMANLAHGINKPLLDSLQIKSGDKILDLASGVGEPAFSAAKLAGQSGLTIATDLVPEMLAALKQREGSNILTFCACDMQDLPLADNSLDKISCRFGLMFVPSPQKAINETFRVLKPATGIHSQLVWGEKENQRIFCVIEDCLKKLFSIYTDHDFERIFSLHEEAHVASFFKNAGFDDIEETVLEFSPVAPLETNFWQSQLDMSFGHLTKSLSKDEKHQLNNKIRDALQDYRIEPSEKHPNGGIQLTLSMRLITGRKP